MSAYDALNKVSAAQVVTAAAVASAFPAVPCETHNEATVMIAATAVGGTTPSITPVFEISPDGTNWFLHTSGVAITANGNQTIKASGNIGRFCRLNYSPVTGTTPTGTFDAWINTKRIGS